MYAIYLTEIKQGTKKNERAREGSRQKCKQGEGWQEYRREDTGWVASAPTTSDKEKPTTKGQMLIISLRPCSARMPYSYF